jgi:hypothetical protein
MTPTQSSIQEHIQRYAQRRSVLASEPDANTVCVEVRCDPREEASGVFTEHWVARAWSHLTMEELTACQESVRVAQDLVGMNEYDYDDSRSMMIAVNDRMEASTAGIATGESGIAQVWRRVDTYTMAKWPDVEEVDLYLLAKGGRGTELQSKDGLSLSCLSGDKANKQLDPILCKHIGKL